MEIVTSSIMIRRFRGIKEFAMDLGMSITKDIRKEGENSGSNQVVIKIKDSFVKRYYLEYGNYITKMGSIGTLGFYVDQHLSQDVFKIFEDDKVYEYTYKNTNDMRSYLNEILDSIFENEAEPSKLGVNMEENIEFTLDKSLSQDEFLQQWKAMRQKMQDMNVAPKG